MYLLRKIDSKILFEEKLDDVILSFDRENMEEILEKAGQSFFEVEKKRRKSFKNNETFILAYNKNNDLIGYMEYGPSWDSKNDLYISSIQIDKRYRTGFLFIKLLLATQKDLLERKFDKIVTGVQKNNETAINIYCKLGFNLTENPKNEKSYLVFADKNILNNEILKKFEKRIKNNKGTKNVS